MPGTPNINVQKSVELFAKLKSSKRALPVALVHIVRSSSERVLENREVGSLLKQDLLVRPWTLSLSYWCGASSHQGGKLLELIFRRVLG